MPAEPKNKREGTKAIHGETENSEDEPEDEREKKEEKELAHRAVKAASGGDKQNEKHNEDIQNRLAERAAHDLYNGKLGSAESCIHHVFGTFQIHDHDKLIAYTNRI